jgi:putative DNA primase/helicase
VTWRYETRGTKRTKVPYRAVGVGPASATDRETWAAYEDAISAFQTRTERPFDGVGFVISPDDPYCGIDLDGSITEQGTTQPWAAAILARFPSYAEVSPSGRGVKIWVRGSLRGLTRNRKGSIEVYDRKRYFTITGQRLPGAPASIAPCQEELTTWHHEVFGIRAEQASRSGHSSPVDDEILRRAISAANGEKFKRLWGGDTSGYPSASEADLALASMIAFYAGGDAAMIERLMCRSGLRRDKWDRHDYLSRTIARAMQSRVRLPHANGSACSIGGRPEPPLPSEEGPVRLGERDPATGRLVLSPSRTLPTAVAFVQEFHQHPERPTLCSYASQLMEWRENRYVAVEDGSVRSKLHPWLHRAVRYAKPARDRPSELVPFDANPRTVGAALETIKAHVYLPAAIGPPAWLDGSVRRPPACEILPCRSISLHIPTGKILDATPMLFVTNAIEFDYDPNAEPPLEWIKFLEQLWGDDLESVSLLQEFMGYALVADTSQQKMLLLVGPRRSGKGTIGRVLTALVGPGSVAGPTINGLASQFGLQGLIGKTLAIVSDARFHGEGVPTVVERLLCISGEDHISIPRKFLSDVTLKLPTRFVFFTNELPHFRDASSALPGRFLILRLTKSFYGSEDPTLTRRLLAELPGILVWALDGLRRLRARGHFVPPASSTEAIGELEDLASPVGAFVRDCCTIGAVKRVECARLFGAWKMWCQTQGRDHPGTAASFGRDLSAVAPGVKRRRGTADVPFYEGIALCCAEEIPI